MDGQQDSGMAANEWMTSMEPRSDALQTPTAYPVLSTLFGPDSFDLELGTLFEFGLGRVLGGVEGKRGGEGGRRVRA
ncbi:hypothetical protein [Streptomyces atroolivaceus]|uniref:hypothetical protein n=1 Tax=Streptomyces atroolivaceus TaxID=66869 RepID=UPI00378B7716